MPEPDVPQLAPEALEAVRALLDDFPLDATVETAMGRMREQVPDFRPIDTERMRQDMVGALGLAVASVRDGGGHEAAEGEGLRTLGALRAEQGIDMDTMLNGFRIIATAGIDAMLDLARRRGVDAAVTLELTRAVWAHCDKAAVELAAGHRAFTADPRRLQMRRGESPLRVLVSRAEPPERREAALAVLGLAADATYTVVALAATDGPATVLDEDVDGRLLASFADLDGDLVVGLVDRPPQEPWGCFVGYGDPAAPDRLAASREGAVRALRLVREFGVERPHHVDEVRLLVAVDALPDLGDELVDRCFGHLSGERRDATTATLRAWFEARGSADAAAEALFVHKNTLRYRLRTFAEATGLVLERPEDAFSVWWALRRLDARGL